MALDKNEIFVSWKSDCMSLGPERFKSSMGSHLLKDLFNRWLVAVGSTEGLEQFELSAIAVLSITSTRSELKRKYAGWADRLKAEFRSLLNSIDFSVVSDSEIDKKEYAQVMTGLPYFTYSALISAWVKHHYEPILMEKYKDYPYLREPRHIEFELQQLILEGHRFGSSVFVAYDENVGSHGTYDHIYLEAWYKEYELKLPESEIEPQWFKICREAYPNIFTPVSSGGRHE